eukprot:gnl/MRDRNA2_/MRDRNA2_17799_c0_seq1.p1 gnl/MRDRNA2_/MRDRNA2_17799_c0~~gnl/MRDRNA2_/MRDRNA2_17799_c0_seq1.p1  ORF type:complete len:114 (-),score=9.78 gnl/MRDRNA2_/MRDRNA2_17799_c0_seq1:471-812(-)
MNLKCGELHSKHCIVIPLIETFPFHNIILIVQIYLARNIISDEAHGRMLLKKQPPVVLSLHLSCPHIRQEIVHARIHRLLSQTAKGDHGNVCLQIQCTPIQNASRSVQEGSWN